MSIRPYAYSSSNVSIPPSIQQSRSDPPYSIASKEASQGSKRKREEPEIVNRDAQQLASESTRSVRRRKDEFSGNDILCIIKGCFKHYDSHRDVLKAIKRDKPKLYQYLQKHIDEALKKVSDIEKKRERHDVRYIDFLYWCPTQFESKNSEQFFYSLRKAILQGTQLEDFVKFMQNEERYLKLVRGSSYESLKKEFKSYASFDYIHANLAEFGEDYLKHAYTVALEFSEAEYLAERLHNELDSRNAKILDLFDPRYWIRRYFSGPHQGWGAVAQGFSVIERKEFMSKDLESLQAESKILRALLSDLSQFMNFWHLQDEYGKESLLGSQVRFLIENATRGGVPVFRFAKDPYGSLVDSLSNCKKEFPQAFDCKKIIRTKLEECEQRIAQSQPQTHFKRKSFYDIYQKELFVAGSKFLFKCFQKSDRANWCHEITQAWNNAKKSIEETLKSKKPFSFFLNEYSKIQEKMMYYFWMNYCNEEPSEILKRQIDKLSDYQFDRLFYELGHLNSKFTDEHLLSERCNILIRTVQKAFPDFKNPFEMRSSNPSEPREALEI